MLLGDPPQLPPHRNRQRGRSLDRAAAAAAGATFIQSAFIGLTRFLAGHLDQAQFGQPQHVRFGVVGFQPRLQFSQDGLLVPFLLHVDEVGHNDAADIPQPKLTGDLRRRFHVGAEHRVRQIGMAGKTAGVDVDDRQGLRPIDHQIAAAFQIDPAVRQPVPFVVDGVMGEQIGLRLVQMDLFDQIRRDEFCQLHHARVRLGVVDDHFIDIVLDMVADDPHHQIGVPVQQKRCFRPLGLCRQGVPQIGQVLEIAGQFLFAAAFGDGPDNDAHSFGPDLLGEAAQAGAFLRGLDPPRHPNIVDARHHHHVAARNREMGGGPRPLRAHRILDDLDHDFSADGQVVLGHQALKRLARKNVARV